MNRPQRLLDILDEEPVKIYNLIKYSYYKYIELPQIPIKGLVVTIVTMKCKNSWLNIQHPVDHS